MAQLTGIRLTGTESRLLETLGYFYFSVQAIEAAQDVYKRHAPRCIRARILVLAHTAVALLCTFRVAVSLWHLIL
jgi:hypothetical protein